MTGTISTAALRFEKSGSAISTIYDASARSKNITPPRFPSDGAK
jgi:hypothetical protein